MATIFSKIINREIPGEIVYETDEVIAFLDIVPTAEGHTLVVPKAEVAAFDQLPPGDLAALATALKTVARGVMAAVGTAHYNLALNNGAPAGQEVPHVHFHVMPRWQGQPRVQAERSYPPGRMAEVGEAIRQAIRKDTSAEE